VSGAVLSEFTPGTPSRPPHFPQRNRIVAGLCLGVVVVEASETSGALITARHALDAGREVMVVPGSALSGRNRGGHALIKDGAALVESARDVIDLLKGTSWRSHLVDVRPAGTAVTPRGPAAPPADWRVGEELDLDDLSALCGVRASSILGQLMHWELAGVVKRTPGGRFVRLGG
jgi:DNA processing protein